MKSFSMMVIFFVIKDDILEFEVVFRYFDNFLFGMYW